MIRKDNIVTKIEKLHREYSSSRKVANRRSEAQISKKKGFWGTSRQPLRRGTRECADHETNQEDKEFPPRPTGARTSRKMGGVRFRPCAQETRQSLRLERPLLSPPANKKRLPFPSSVAQSSPRRRPAPTLQLLSQMKNTEQLGERVLRRGRKRATKKHRLSSTGGHAGSNQADRSFRDIRAD
ncbi:hypothetical protein GWK47_034645 [Chionoecetes opilio]|uniref:Uncharacterized protein n=1 Tax=Chionoecetes opilio TaxID=41210 RepID=A0A8J4YIR6_CHIOP|nr:hypothetical protein GWK47_034645 [Chionoecetes opilio]